MELALTASVRRSARRAFSAARNCASGRRRLRGAATVEAILVLGVIVLVWAGVNYAGRVGMTKQKSLSEARGCAFVMATNSCQGVPDYCEVRTEEGGSSEETSKLSQQAAESSEAEEDTDAVSQELSSQIDKGFFRRARARAGAEIVRPEPIGGGEVSVGAEFGLPCNPKPGSLGDKIKDMFQDIFGKLKGKK